MGTTKAEAEMFECQFCDLKGDGPTLRRHRRESQHLIRVVRAVDTSDKRLQEMRLNGSADVRAVCDELLQLRADLAPAGENEVICAVCHLDFDYCTCGNSVAPAGELVSKEAQIIAEIERMRDDCKRGDGLNPPSERCRWFINAAERILRNLRALPPVARVPDAARKLAEEIANAIIDSDYFRDRDGAKINSLNYKFFEAIIESHCGVARVPEEEAYAVYKAENKSKHETAIETAEPLRRICEPTATSGVARVPETKWRVLQVDENGNVYDKVARVPESSCPCVYTEPCDPRCTCINPSSSRGCMRCCAYGSLEQRQDNAKRLVARVPVEETLQKK